MPGQSGYLLLFYINFIFKSYFLLEPQRFYIWLSHVFFAFPVIRNKPWIFLCLSNLKAFLCTVHPLLSIKCPPWTEWRRLLEFLARRLFFKKKEMWRNCFPLTALQDTHWFNIDSQCKEAVQKERGGEKIISLEKHEWISFFYIGSPAHSSLQFLFLYFAIFSLISHHALLLIAYYSTQNHIAMPTPSHCWGLQATETLSVQRF